MLSHDDYTVAWICPLEIEQVAAEVMLDEEHPRLPQPPNDSNSYTLGSIDGHNVVIAGLPTTGNCSAATVVAHLRGTFPKVRFGLLVGIGGGVPRVRLGDVVVSEPTGVHSGAIQYDHGKAQAGVFERTGCLAPPPNVLLGAARRAGVVREKAALKGTDPLAMHLERLSTKKFRFPGRDKDHLYEAGYVHVGGPSCKNCDPSKRMERIQDHDEEETEDEDADEETIVVYRGTIASGELVMRDALFRDTINDVLCFEMEAAGVLNDFPCLVIRGISDYSDSHKNDKWQGYAAATAAAYARELFFHMPVAAVEECRIAREDVQQMIEDTREIRQTQRSDALARWLGAPDPSTNYNEARKLCHPGTGEWFLESEQYRRWRDGSHSMWLHGIPGCGKTVLSSTVLTELRKSPGVVLYFYFDFKDANKQSLDKMLRSLLLQVSQHEGLNVHLEQLYHSCRDGQDQPRTEALRKILEAALKERTVNILLDALDESSPRTEVLAWLSLPEHWSWQFFITSREEHDIKTALREWIKVEDIVPIQVAPVDEDIRAMVRTALEHDKGFNRWRKTDALILIETRLMEKAQGMFRMAVCQIDSLRDCLSLPELRQRLDELPGTLTQTYDQILRDIPAGRRESATRILQFLTYSKRPLLLEEMVDVLAVRPDAETTFHVEDRMPDPEEIARYCGSLTTIVTQTIIRNPVNGCPQERGWPEGLNPNFKELQLAHLTVKEYLASEDVEASFRVQLQAVEARACIVKVSLAYLSHTSRLGWRFISSRRRRPSSRWVSSRRDGFDYPLSRYAARHWYEHGPSAEKFGGEALEWVRKLLTTEAFYKHWLCLNGHLGDWDDPLRFASAMGLAKMVELLLQDECNVNALGRWGTALYAASRAGHLSTVQLLLAKGADTEVCRSRTGTALFAASKTGPPTFAQQLLMARNAKANGCGAATIYVPVHVAASQGHTKIVDLLLARAAHDHAKRRGGLLLSQNYYSPEEFMEPETALQAASSQGHVETIRMLLDAGADANNALPIASRSGRLDILGTLLEYSVKNLKALNISLCDAAPPDHVELKLRLVKVADHYIAALSEALDAGPEVMRLIMENGVNDLNTTLKAASMSVRVGVPRFWTTISTTKCLWQQHTDTNAREYNHMTVGGKGVDDACNSRDWWWLGRDEATLDD